MNILVTGGAGFIGSNFIHYMLSKYNDRIINLDLLTYAGNSKNHDCFKSDERYMFIQGDIGDKELVTRIFEQYDIQYVVNFAAESHVDRSIEDPDIFIKTNVLGTQNLLNIARKFWSVDPLNSKCTLYREGVKFLQVSTDEVYGSLGETGYFHETTPISPNSPYSASKASADLLVRAYYETFGLPNNITRCSNNYGPYQYPEKLIPLMIYNAVNDIPLPVYGDGRQIRDWLYVEDHCSAIDLVLRHGKINEIYNVGGNNEEENINIVKKVLRKLGKSEALISYVVDRLGHDRRYAIDHTKITRELGWKPQVTFEKGLELTIEWYSQHMDWLLDIINCD